MRWTPSGKIYQIPCLEKSNYRSACEARTKREGHCEERGFARDEAIPYANRANEVLTKLMPFEFGGCPPGWPFERASLKSLLPNRSGWNIAMTAPFLPWACYSLTNFAVATTCTPRFIKAVYTPVANWLTSTFWKPLYMGKGCRCTTCQTSKNDGACSDYCSSQQGGVFANLGHYLGRSTVQFRIEKLQINVANYFSCRSGLATPQSADRCYRQHVCTTTQPPVLIQPDKSTTKPTIRRVI